MSKNDYAANFADFLAARPKDKPFDFWFGGQEPQRAFAKGSGLKAGKRLEDATPPPFLPPGAPPSTPLASVTPPRATTTGPIRNAPCAHLRISTSAIFAPTVGPPTTPLSSMAKENPKAHTAATKTSIPPRR